jgi:hypothetical protein
MELKTIIVLNDPSVVIFQKYNKYFLNENNIDFNTNTKTNTKIPTPTPTPTLVLVLHAIYF